MATQSQAPSKAIITSVGSAQSGGTASSSTPLIQGTADAGTLIKVYDGARLIGTASVETDGSWSFTPPGDLKGGKHQFTVISVLGENWGASSDQFVVTVPAVALPPAAPVVTGLTDNVGPIQGLIKPNETTDDARPAMTGTGTAGDTIKVYDNGTLIGSATVEPDGQWSVKPTADLANGSHEIYAIETNAAGVPSADSAHILFKVDTTTPSTPVIDNVQDNVGPVTGPVVAGSTTDDARPVISGTGKAGDTVKLYDGSTLIGSATVGTDGKWSIQPAAALSNAEHTLTATDTNLAGTVSPASAYFGFTVDTTTPATPAAPVVTDNGTLIPSGGTMPDGQPVISGTGKAGDTIKIYDGSTVMGSATIGGDGKWSFKPTTDLSYGGHDLSVIETNPAGTSSAASAHVTFTVVVPAPVITNIGDAVGPVQGTVPDGGTTDDTHVMVSGKGLVGYNVWVYVGSTVVAGAVVDANGNWSARCNAGLANGTSAMSAKQFLIDTSMSGWSNTWTITVDTSIPAAPAIVTVMDNVGTIKGAIAPGGVTDDARPVVNGTGKAGDIVKLYDGSTLIGTVKVGTDGKWSIQPAATLSDTGHDLWATDTNLAGTVSPASAHFGFKVDTTTPATPAAPLITDNGVTVPFGGALFDGHPAISGTGTSGDTIKVYDNGNVIGSTTIGGDGKWSYTPATDLAGGSHIITIVETNPAGTSSSPSNGIAFSYQPAPMPTAPTITGVTDVGGPYEGNVPSGGTSSDGQPTVKGTGANSGDIIKVYDGSTLLGSTTVGTNGTWSFKTPALSNGVTHSLTATEMNGTGTSPSSTPYPIYVDTTSWAGAQIVITGVYDQTGRLIPKGGTASGPLTVTVWTAVAGSGVRLLNNANDSNSAVIEAAGSHVATITIAGYTGWSGSGYKLGTGTLNLDAQWGASKATAYSGGGYSVYVASWTYSPSYKSVLMAHDDSVSAAADAAVLSNSSGTQPEHHTVVGEHDAFKGTAGDNETVDLNADPTSYFKEATAHIEGAKGGAVDTLHLTGDHQILDLTSLTGKTAAAKISGIEVIDLGGQHNTLKLSLVDVLNLGETDLFQQDGKQQLMVNGKEGDVVDLSNSHVAGLAEGEWQQHGTTQVSGVTYNVYEHSGAHTELLVQQGVQIAVH